MKDIETMSKQLGNIRTSWSKVEYFEGFGRVVSLTKTSAFPVLVKVEPNCISINNQFYIHFSTVKELVEGVENRIKVNTIKTQGVELENKLLNEAVEHAIVLLHSYEKETK